MGKSEIKSHISEKCLNHLAKSQISNPYFPSNCKYFKSNLEPNIKSFMKMNVWIDFQLRSRHRGYLMHSTLVIVTRDILIQSRYVHNASQSQPSALSALNCIRRKLSASTVCALCVLCAPLQQRYTCEEKICRNLNLFGSRPSDHYFRSVCLSVCLCRVLRVVCVCAQKIGSV